MQEIYRLLYLSRSIKRTSIDRKIIRGPLTIEEAYEDLQKNFLGGFTSMEEL